jgi:predicted nucleic acid-binding protein
LTIYADSSVFVSLYINDQHSPQARKWFTSRPSVWFTPLHRAEWMHAVEQHVFRGYMTAGEARKVYLHFELDSGKGLWLDTLLPESAFRVAVDLARKHVAHIGTRTLDSLHVASALELKAERFWTFDERQKKLAKAAGLKTS